MVSSIFFMEFSLFKFVLCSCKINASKINPHFSMCKLAICKSKCILTLTLCDGVLTIIVFTYTCNVFHEHHL